VLDRDWQLRKNSHRGPKLGSTIVQPARPLLTRRRRWRNRLRLRRTSSGRSVYNYFRDYDAVTGRYVQSDPIGLAGGLNPYLYAEANPLRYSDPLGLTSVTLAFYYGRGGAVTFGWEGGKPFVTADVGFGVGGGLSVNPTGGFPRPGDSCGVPESEEAFLGFQGTLGANLGPLGVGGTGYTGWNISRDSEERPKPRFVEGLEPFGRWRQSDGSWGLRLQLSGGARVGLAWPKSPKTIAGVK
jgi:RHS repeat-associated protein